jgi:hypothetical protein
MSRKVWRVALALSRGDNTHTELVTSGTNNLDQDKFADSSGSVSSSAPLVLNVLSCNPDRQSRKGDNVYNYSNRATWIKGLPLAVECICEPDVRETVKKGHRSLKYVYLGRL